VWLNVAFSIHEWHGGSHGKACPKISRQKRSEVDLKEFSRFSYE